MTVPSFPRGAEWRKWDLHVHVPGTQLNDGYKVTNRENTVDKYCQVLHESDVAVFGLTDYFSLSQCFQVKKRYHELYPDCFKLLLVNLELRLDVAVNREGQAVNLHLVFSPDVSEADATKFLTHLKTSGTKGATRTAVTCDDLESREDYEKASVDWKAIDDAIRDTFGEYAIRPEQRQRYLLVIASAKGDGIRAGGAGIARKNQIQDEIDKRCDAIFANASSREWYLHTDRYETDETSVPKPVFDGSDAHSFADLETSLGQHVTDEGRNRSITWIKADPTYEGLLQTLVEPADRVAIQPTEPDSKEPYRVISAVRFSGIKDFPEEISFNKNLSSIIGSRSSGKSALLAHVAHAVDASETIKSQMNATGNQDWRQMGPAAGYTWEDVSDAGCVVEWASGSETNGRVIYIPQNALYSLSERPEEITQKISPALFREYPSLKSEFDNMSQKVERQNSKIDSDIKLWFEYNSQITEKRRAVGDLGDKAAIEHRRAELEVQVAEIRRMANLSDVEALALEQVVRQISDTEAGLQQLRNNLGLLMSHVFETESTDVESISIKPDAVEVSIEIRPDQTLLPEVVAEALEEMRANAVCELRSAIEEKIVNATHKVKDEIAKASDRLEEIRSENVKLLEKQEANHELSSATSDLNIQTAALGEIAKQEELLSDITQLQDASAQRIIDSIAVRNKAIESFVQAFKEEQRELKDLYFSIEAGIHEDDVKHASTGFNQRTRSEYLPERGEPVAFLTAQQYPSKFLDDLATGRVPLNKGYSAQEV